MSEIIGNQIILTLPIHFFAYAPFRNHLRFEKKVTFFLLFTAEAFYILLFSLLLRSGVSIPLIQSISIPIFGGLLFVLVKEDWGKIMFLIVFSVAYILAVRGTAGFLELFLFPNSRHFFYSWPSSFLSLILYALTMPAMQWYFKRTAKMVFESHAPQVWKRVWLLPLFNTMIVLLFTYSPQSPSQINASFLLARVLLLLCMFIIYYYILRSISQLQESIAAAEHSRYLERLAELQTTQYGLLKTRIEETRRTRHDLRQHLRAVQGYIDNGDLISLSSYIQAYEETIPLNALHGYSGNYAVDSILGFYAEKASSEGTEMKISFCSLPALPIPEPEFCVLLGNLLENALEACQRDLPYNTVPSVITVQAAPAGSHMLILAVDNPCPAPPHFQGERLLSHKHEGFGNGTESVRSIAEKYHGNAAFEWKNGMFQVSITLNFSSNS